LMDARVKPAHDEANPLGTLYRRLSMRGSRPQSHSQEGNKREKSPASTFAPRFLGRSMPGAPSAIVKPGLAEMRF